MKDLAIRRIIIYHYKDPCKLIRIMECQEGFEGYSIVASVFLVCFFVPRSYMFICVFLPEKKTKARKGVKKGQTCRRNADTSLTFDKSISLWDVLLIFTTKTPPASCDSNMGDQPKHISTSRWKKSLALMPGRFSFSNLRFLVGLFSLVWSGKELTGEKLKMFTWLFGYRLVYGL